MNAPIPDVTQSPHAAKIIEVAETHELIFLRRLLAKTRREGPDGEVIRDRGELAALGVLTQVLQQADRA